VENDAKGALMKKDYTHISVLLDRTGSMESIRDDIIGGFNTFLEEQQKELGEATMTLVQFDSQGPYEVVQDLKPLAEITKLTRETYVPRASTPLLDAMGRTINDLEKRLAGMIGDARPEKVVVVIITDGQENASRELRKDQVEKMIKERTEKDGWQFVFLSADLAAIGDALAAGFHADAMLMFTKTGQGTRDAYSSLSNQMINYRKGWKDKLNFDEQDRKADDDPFKKKPN
jgi:hypothetical protein